MIDPSKIYVYSTNLKKYYGNFEVPNRYLEKYAFILNFIRPKGKHPKIFKTYAIHNEKNPKKERPAKHKENNVCNQHREQGNLHIIGTS